MPGIYRYKISKLWVFRVDVTYFHNDGVLVQCLVILPAVLTAHFVPHSGKVVADILQGSVVLQEFFVVKIVHLTLRETYLPIAIFLGNTVKLKKNLLGFGVEHFLLLHLLPLVIFGSRTPCASVHPVILR